MCLKFEAGSGKVDLAFSLPGLPRFIHGNFATGTADPAVAASVLLALKLAMRMTEFWNPISDSTRSDSAFHRAAIAFEGLAGCSKARFRQVSRVFFFAKQTL